jgi:hypothetical protein
MDEPYAAAGGRPTPSDAEPRDDGHARALSSAGEPPPGDVLVDSRPDRPERPGDGAGHPDEHDAPDAAGRPAGGADGSGGEEPDPGRGEDADLEDEHHDWLVRLVNAAVVTVCMIFVWLQLHPHLLLSNTTPSGGDMGAHVWGPAYLRDHLLPHLRLSGWTPDWYAGFPAYQYYMVVPALAIVALDVVLPYGVAFKLVSVSGLVCFPLAAFFLGRLFRLRFPGPALLAVFTLPFLFDTTFTIYGGNIASTLAGEFAFSISLALLLLYLGFLSRGLETGRHRSVTAVLFALVATCHPLPLLGMASVATLAIVGWHVVEALRGPEPRRQLRSTGWWLLTGLGSGALLSAFWIVPFLLRGAYLNDMGWERLPTNGGKLLQYLFHAGSDTNVLSGWDRLSVMPALWFICVALAVVGVALSWVYREKLGCILSITAIGEVLVFCFIPQGRFWNARVLPFWYLSIYLLAAVGVALLTRLVRSVPARTSIGLATFAIVLIGVALPLGVLAGSTRGADGRWRFLGMSAKESFVKSWAKWNYSGYEGKTAYPEYYDVITKMQQVGQQQGCGRALWEYDNDRLNGYGTPMALMLLPYWTNGCIGSMEGLFFEASASTPYHFLMQSELSSRPSRPQRNLPYRDLDVDLGVRQLQLYGVRYYMAFTSRAVAAARANPALTELGQVGGNEALLKQLTASPASDQGAIDRASPWVIFEVAGSDLVEPLEYDPTVLTGVGQHQHQWLKPSTTFFDNPKDWDVFPAASGPPEWPRAEDTSQPLPRTPATPAVVADVRTTDDTISFTVDKASIGSPVLVKASYFPNWHVKGADGPYRVMPNLMVVVPTSTKVKLSYG